MILTGDEFNFELLNNSIVTNYGLPYDYDSTDALFYDSVFY